MIETPQTTSRSCTIRFSSEAAQHINTLAGRMKSTLVEEAIASGEQMLTHQADAPTFGYMATLSKRAVEIGVDMGDTLLTKTHVDLAAEEIAERAMASAGCERTS